MYFVRIDFTYKGSPVHRTRDLVKDYQAVAEMVSTMTASGYHVLQVRVELCN